jgi:hypothetical protein
MPLLKAEVRQQQGRDMPKILILGSSPYVTAARAWPRMPFDRIVAINNAHAVRPDWDVMIHPHDFPADRVPMPRTDQRIVTETGFVPAQNAYGGFVYAGATMAFTAAYWALHILKPRVVAMFGCDMVYPPRGPTHFYGTGTADPLRPDITLQSLEAKSARLMILAAMQGCTMVNLSRGPSRLIFPRANPDALARTVPPAFDKDRAAQALAREAALAYDTPDGRYWDDLSRFDAAELRALDALWLAAARPALRLSA